MKNCKLKLQYDGTPHFFRMSSIKKTNQRNHWQDCRALLNHIHF